MFIALVEFIRCTGYSALVPLCGLWLPQQMWSQLFPVEIQNTFSKKFFEQFHLSHDSFYENYKYWEILSATCICSEMSQIMDCNKKLFNALDITKCIKSPIDLVRKGNSLKSKLHFQQHKNLLEIALFFNIILGKLKGSLLVNTEVQASLLTSIKIIIDPRLLYSLCCSLFLDKGHKWQSCHKYYQCSHNVTNTIR